MVSYGVTMPKDDWTRITLRLPPDIHGALVKAAGLSNLSLNRQIVELLSTGLGIAIVEGGHTLESVRATSDESKRLSAELDRMIEEAGAQRAELVKMLQQAEAQRATLDEMIAEEKRRLDELKGSA